MCGARQAGRFCERDGYDFLAAALQPNGSMAPGPAPGSGPAPAPGPGVARAPALGPVRAPAADPERTPAAGPERAPAAGPERAPAAGSERAPVAGPEQVQAAGSQRAPAAAQEWLVVVGAERAYFETVRAAGGPDAGALSFPLFCPERRFPLRGAQALVGRRSRSRGIYPDIDLVGPPEDLGVSHAHALLLVQPDGGLAVVDLDSANGTYLNDGTDPIAANAPVPVRDGDRIYLGAWTVLTVHTVTTPGEPGSG